MLTARWRPACELIGPCETTLRVLPNNLDIFGHVNNGVYLTLMDLARTDMMLRAGVLARIFRNGWYPIVASESIRFRRSLKLGQRFSINTRVLGWNEKSVYLLQTFSRSHDHATVAEALVEARFLSRRGGQVTPTEMLTFLNLADRYADQAALPAWVDQWHESVNTDVGRMHNN